MSDEELEKKYLDQGTSASNPGGVILSLAKLALFKKELGWFDRLLVARTLPVAHIKEHLYHSDACAALVVQVEPVLKVMAYSGDIDCVVQLKFPHWVREQHPLQVGMPLLTVNTYMSFSADSYECHAHQVVKDLLPGESYSNWINFHPLIAQFLTDDPTQAQANMDRIPQSEWVRINILAREHAQKFPERCRDGNPYRSDEPKMLSL